MARPRVGLTAPLRALIACLVAASPLLLPSIARGEPCSPACVKDATGAAGKQVDVISDTVDEATGGASTPATDNLRSAAEAADDAAGSVDSTTGGARASGEQALNEAMDKASSEVVDPVLGTVEGVTAPDPEGPGRVGGPSLNNRFNGNARRATGPTHIRALELQRRAALAAAAASAATARAARVDTAGPDTPVLGLDPRTATQLALSLEDGYSPEDIIGAAVKMAFPLLLMLLVGGYLVLQSRVDAKDPKLIAAPVGPDQEYLSFSRAPPLPPRSPRRAGPTSHPSPSG